jgi:hypothetical protein
MDGCRLRAKAAVYLRIRAPSGGLPVTGLKSRIATGARKFECSNMAPRCHRNYRFVLSEAARNAIEDLRLFFFAKRGDFEARTPHVDDAHPVT